MKEKENESIVWNAGFKKEEISTDEKLFVLILSLTLLITVSLPMVFISFFVCVASRSLFEAIKQKRKKKKKSHTFMFYQYPLIPFYYLGKKIHENIKSFVKT